jgi:hypothetical protein
MVPNMLITTFDAGAGLVLPRAQKAVRRAGSGRSPMAAAVAAMVLILGSAVALNSVLAAEIFALDGAGLAAGGGTAAPPAKLGRTKLTMGLDTLSTEYQVYRQAVANGAARAGTFSTKKTMARVVGETVVIDAVAADDPEALSASLEALGAEVTAVAGRIVSARLPLGEIPELDYLDALKFARPAVAASRIGAVTSQGDVAQASDLARSSAGVDGSGSVVGVLSDSFNCLRGYSADVATGDLPAGVNILSDITSDCTDEGRAMAQIVHDVAPGAGLAFHTAWNGEADFAQGIRDLAAAGSTIIVDDVYYYAEPMFQDGVIAQAVEQVSAAGIVYFSSAGNSGRQAYEAAFRGARLPGYFGGELHDFDPGPGVDTRLSIQQNADTYFVLQWRDPFFSVSGPPGAGTDLDICVYYPVGAATPLACSSAYNVGDDPFEFIGLTGAGTVEVAIERWSGIAPNPIKLVMYGNIGFAEPYLGINAGTISGHANAAAANAVGAAAYFLTPAFGEDPPVLNYYSSAGNTPILFDPAGNPTSQVRHKPELTAPDGGNNTFFGSDLGSDADAWPNFFGTSAAAPHAAGVAALMRDARPALTPIQITAALQKTAVDMIQRETLSFGGPRATIGTGCDNSSGAGLIDALGALNVEALPSPPDLIGTWRPSTHSFYLDATGSYRWDPCGIVVSFGYSTDLPLSGDWDGDGTDEIGIWRPGNRTFYLDGNGNYAWDPAADISATFGLSTDKPVVGDWNGDGADDIGVWRPSTRAFYLDFNGNFRWDSGTDITATFGIGTDMPLSGDWDGDGSAEIGVWRPSARTFYLDVNGNYVWDSGADVSATFGSVDDRPLSGDWDDSGRDKIGVWRPSTGTFYLDTNGNYAWDSPADSSALFGLSTDTPVVGRW